MGKWMVEFLRKYESRSNKIAGVNSIRITKSIISYPVGVRCDVNIFKLTARVQSSSREVYVKVKKNIVKRQKIVLSIYAKKHILFLLSTRLCSEV